MSRWSKIDSCRWPCCTSERNRGRAQGGDPRQAAGFSHIAKTTANGVTTILISGQIGWADGAEAPAATLAEQAEIAFTNVVKRLEQAGASAEDIVKTNVYIKDIDPEKVQAAGRAQAKVLQLDPPRASTWVGVTGLVYPSLLIEVEATAVVAAEE